MSASVNFKYCRTPRKRQPKPDVNDSNVELAIKRNRQMHELLMMVAQTIGTIATKETIDAYGMMQRVNELVDIEKQMAPRKLPVLKLKGI